MANMHFPTYLPPVEKPEQISPLALAYRRCCFRAYVRTYLVCNILHKNEFNL